MSILISFFENSIDKIFETEPPISSPFRPRDDCQRMALERDRRYGVETNEIRVLWKPMA